MNKKINIIVKQANPCDYPLQRYFIVINNKIVDDFILHLTNEDIYVGLQDATAHIISLKPLNTYKDYVNLLLEYEVETINTPTKLEELLEMKRAYEEAFYFNEDYYGGEDLDDFMERYGVALYEIMKKLEEYLRQEEKE